MELSRIRDRLDHLTWQMLLILKERLSLVREVARQKQKKGGGVIHAPQREAEILYRLQDDCRVHELDSDYVLEIVSLMIAHAKDAECDILGVKTFLNVDRIPPEKLREDLLSLTRVVACEYRPDYLEGDAVDAIRSYRNRERSIICDAIASTRQKQKALDLGCASGEIAEELSHFFGSVIGYDVSEEMIKVARGGSGRRNVTFEVADLERGIPVESQSVDFIVANFGSASEISSDPLQEISRVLRSGGKAFLSFCNQDAISSMWYYPWPSTLRAHHNRNNDTLEVWFRDKVYTIFSRGMTLELLRVESEKYGLKLKRSETYPTFQAILPRFFFGSNRFRDLVNSVAEVDDSLAKNGPHKGTYLTAVVSKP